MITLAECTECLKNIKYYCKPENVYKGYPSRDGDGINWACFCAVKHPGIPQEATEFFPHFVVRRVSAELRAMGYTVEVPTGVNNVLKPTTFVITWGEIPEKPKRYLVRRSEDGTLFSRLLTRIASLFSFNR